MFAVVNNGAYAKLERIDLSTNLVSVQQFPVTNIGNMVYVAVPPESGAGGFLTYNTTQTLTASATSAPLIARILDSTGRPLYKGRTPFRSPRARELQSGGHWRNQR